MLSADCGVSTTKKACKNCTCGRADGEKVEVKLTQEMLENPQSGGCGSVSHLLNTLHSECQACNAAFLTMSLFTLLHPYQTALPDAVDGVLLSQTANTAVGLGHADMQLLPFPGFTGSICSLLQIPTAGLCQWACYMELLLTGQSFLSQDCKLMHQTAFRYCCRV